MSGPNSDDGTTTDGTGDDGTSDVGADRDAGDTTAADVPVGHGDGGDPEAVAGPQRRSWWKRAKRWQLIAVLGGAVTVAAAVAGFVVVATHNSAAPADAVRDYVETIARGDAEGANRMVDPADFPGRPIDTSLLTDEVLGSASRLHVQEVELREIDGEPADSVTFSPHGAVAEVHVEYVVDGGPQHGGPQHRASQHHTSQHRGEVTLRARLTGSTLGLWEHWTVIDPLVVPAYVETSMHEVAGVAGMEGATIGGVAVPANPHGIDAVDRTYFLLYPGVYTVRGVESPYFTAEPETLVAAERSWNPDEFWEPDDHTPPAGLARVGYDDTAQLRAKVADETERLLRACADAVPDVREGCPQRISGYSDMTAATIDRVPVVRLTLAQSGGDEPPFLWLRSDDDGRVEARFADGSERSMDFFVTGKVRIDEAGRVSVRLLGW